MSTLCDIAVESIAVALTTGERRVPDVDDLTADLREPAATFVTLERGARLLGCIGSLDARQPLAVDVAEHALAAAFDDPRLPAVTRADFPVMTVKVSVLSKSEPIDVSSFDALRATVRPGVDGITVAVGTQTRATLLPSVWAKVPDRDEFLDALWLKAGLRPRSWPRMIRVARYTSVETSDPGPRPAL